jgi:hypothetical protein
MLSSSIFSGEIASTMDKLTTRALQAQVEAAVRLLLPVWNCYGALTFMVYVECRPREQ